MQHSGILLFQNEFCQLEAGRSRRARYNPAVTKREFLRELERQMELPEASLNLEAPLASLEGWDSMAALLFIALADEKVGVVVSGDQVGKARTLSDLLSLLGDRLT
jgi:Phosphopantetheine attachment site